MGKSAGCLQLQHAQQRLAHDCKHLSGSDNPGTRSVAQVMDGVINKYEEGADGAVVFEGYEKGLQALLSAYTASSPGEHFQLAQQDTTKLTQVCFSCVRHLCAIQSALNPIGISMNRTTIIDTAVQLLNTMLCVPYHAVLCCAVPCRAVLCRAVPCRAILRSSMQLCMWQPLGPLTAVEFCAGCW